MYTISFASQKGGVGKTVSTVFLASFLQREGYRPLVIDLDSQMNSTSWLLGRHLEPNEASVYDSLLTQRRGMEGEQDWPLAELIEPSENVGGVDFVPASRDLAVADSELSNAPFVLKDRLDELDGESGPESGYDFCLIDCPPSLGSLVYIALSASEGVVIPVKAAQFSMDGLGQLLNTVKEVQRLNQDLSVMGFLLNNLDWRFGETQKGVDQVVNAYGDMVFDTKVPLRAKIVEASRGKDPASHVSGSDAEEIYSSLTKEIIKRATSNE